MMLSLLLLVTASAATCAPVGKMHQVVVTKNDPADPISQLAVVEADIPKPGAGEVLIHMSAMPVNPADMFSIMGVYPPFNMAGIANPVPGLEGTGVLIQFGQGSKAMLADSSLKQGSRVVAYVAPSLNQGYGTYREYFIAKAEDVVAVPDDVSDESASQFLVNPVTVIGMLNKLAAPKGEYILQSAGGSTIGKQLVQIAKAMGLKTISTVRRCDQVKELLAYGADHVICDPVAEIGAKVQEITSGKGAWGAVDAVAGDMTAALQGGVRANGHVLIYGALAGMDFKGSVLANLFMGQSVSGFWLNLMNEAQTPEERRKMFTQSLEYMRSGTMTPHTGKKMTLHEVKDAFKEANRPGRSSDGKVLLTTDSSCMQKIKDEL